MLCDVLHIHRIRSSPAAAPADARITACAAEGLRIEGDVLPWFENRKKELANRPRTREQAFGEALDADKLGRLGRYEGAS